MSLQLDEITARNFKAFYEKILPYLNNDQGTHDFLDLINKPRINGVELTGNVASSSLGLESIQYETIPQANSLNEGQIIQYIGITDQDYTNGRFYECVHNENDTYSWKEKQVSKGKDNVQDKYFNDNDNLFYEENTFTTAVTPEDNVIYQDILTNNQYRWNGSRYVQTNTGGTRIVELTQQQYDNLTDEEQNDGSVYFITDDYTSPFEITRCYTPVGTIIAVMGNSAPKNYLVCDGTEYNIADYPTLAEYFRKEFGEINHFGGDGISTFAVPDLTGRFLKQGIPGTLEEAGLPNITGRYTHNLWIAAAVDGAVYNSSGGKNSINSGSTSGKPNGWYFDASRCSSVYGNSDTVTPANLQVLFCIAVTDIYDTNDIENLIHQMEDRLSPIGNIISFMGNHAPNGYLVCDGTEYNITDYPLLASFFEAEFETVNHFGGDGETTFAVPDLRGEFLRGTGTNSYDQGGAGAAVGVHQAPTRHMYWWNGSGSQVAPYIYNNGVNQDASGPTVQSGTFGSWNNKNYGKYIQYFTSRPTNTSVLYCIKAEYVTDLPSDTVSVTDLITEDLNDILGE